MSLFVDLHKHRPRLGEGDKRNRDRLEDWLTECFAAALRALSAADRAKTQQVLAQLTGASEVDIADALKHHDLRIETQISNGADGRPDMAFWLDDWPWAVVENKVGHAATGEQLSGYRSWQASGEPNKPARFRASLCPPCCSFRTTPSRPKILSNHRGRLVLEWARERFGDFKQWTTSWLLFAWLFFARLVSANSPHQAARPSLAFGFASPICRHTRLSPRRN